MGTNDQKATRAKKTPGYTGGGLLHVIKDLNETDVLLGRGTGPSEHKGNREFRYLIAKRTNEFNSTDNRQTKSRIAEQTLKDVKVKNGRFLRRLDKSEHRFISDKTSGAPELDDVLYVQVDDVIAVLKTKQAFRYCSRTATASPQAVASSTTEGIIPSRVRDPVSAKQEQQDQNKSLLAALPLRQAQVFCEQLKAAEMEIKSAAIFKRMWQSELLAQHQQQEHQARLVTSSLIAACPRSRYFLGPTAQTNSLDTELLARASAITSSPPSSALVTSAGLEGEGPAQRAIPHLAGGSRSVADFMVQQHGGMNHRLAPGRNVPSTANHNRRGAELILSLLDQQARGDAAARMKRECAGRPLYHPAILRQPRLFGLSAAPPRAGSNLHPAGGYRLNDNKQMQY